MTNREWLAYIAGFADGEGCFRLPMGHCTKTPIIQISQTGRLGNTVLNEIKDFLVTMGIEHARVCNHKVHIRKKLMYTLIISNFKESLQFLELVMPFLRIKRHTAQDLIRFLKMYPSRSRVWHAHRWAGNTCFSGHPITPENTGMAAGKRFCKPCRNTYMRAYQAKRAARRESCGV